MLGGQFPASAANSLIQGYCEDFVGFAAVLAQTLEQVSMRNIDLKPCRGDLERIENGMRNLAEAIHDLLQRQPQKGGERSARAAETPTPPAASAPAPAPAPAGKSSPATPPAAQAQAKPAAPSNTYVHVDMRPDSEDQPRPAEPKGQKAPSPATNTPKPTPPAPAAKKDAPAEKAASPSMATTPAPAAPAPAGAAAAAPASTNQAPTASPTPTAGPRPVAAPANRAKAAAPGTAPRPAATPAAAGDRRIGPRAQARPENLKGTNRSMPLLSVMQFLGRMRKRGTMKVQLSGELLTFEIENGCVMAAMSDKCPRDERLGDILCDMDVCTREQLEPLELLVESGAAAERFGQLVLEHGFASDQQIVAALETQVRTRFSRACKHLDSAYEFVEGERNSAPPAFPVQPLAIA